MKGKLTTVTLKITDKPKHGKTNIARIKKITEAELEANALRDEDNLLFTKKQLMQFKRVFSQQTSHRRN